MIRTLLVLGLALLPLAVYVETAAVKAASAPAKTQSAKPQPPKVVQPSLKVKTLAGSEFDLAAHRGKFVVVNFWATWCGPCLKEIPDLSAFDRARDDVDVIGLAFEEIEPADLKTFLTKHPASYPIALVDVYAPPADFDVPRGLPTTYLIGPDGKIAERFLGPVTSAELERAVAKHRASAKPKGA